MPSARFLIILIIPAMMSFQAGAQTSKPVSMGQSKATKVLGSQLNTILQFGMAGGTLGLSTLSFYGRPQDKLAYIPVGMALGIIVGTIYSTSQMVSVPQDVTAQVDTGSLRAPPLSHDFQWTFDF